MDLISALQRSQGHVYLGNTVQSWTVALAAALVVLLITLVLRRVAVKYYGRLANTKTVELTELPMKVISKTSTSFLVVVSIAVGISLLDTSDKVQRISHVVLTIAIFWQIGLWASTAALEWLGVRRIRSAESDKAAVGTLTILAVVIPAIIWVIMVLLTLDNLGINITTLVAGLGIGGVAIALATQKVLSDLLASLSIALDKPFVMGDFVIIDAFMGSVEYIGIKSTRLRSLSGEQIVMANADMLSSRLRNYGRMQDRRIQFTVSVRYGTPDEVLERIPKMITDIICTEKELRFDRSHLSNLGPNSVDFESVYIVTSADYNTYMDIQQRILLGIYKAFVREHIEFSLPTRHLIIEPIESPAVGAPAATGTLASAVG
jgi:small-conductance mechanosensitive channel